MKERFLSSSPTDKVASGALILHRQLQQDLSAFACPFNHHCLSAFPNQLPRLREHPIDHVIVMTGIVMEKQNPFHIRIDICGNSGSNLLRLAPVALLGGGSAFSYSLV